MWDFSECVIVIVIVIVRSLELKDRVKRTPTRQRRRRDEEHTRGRLRGGPRKMKTSVFPIASHLHGYDIQADISKEKRTGTVVRSLQVPLAPVAAISCVISKYRQPGALARLTNEWNLRCQQSHPSSQSLFFLKRWKQALLVSEQLRVV